MMKRLDSEQENTTRTGRRLDLVTPVLVALALALTGCPDECFQEFGDQDCRFNQGESRCGIGESRNTVEECIRDSGSGCHLWTEAEACEGSLRCDPVEGACVCRDRCGRAGATTCVDDVIFTCEEDAQGCLVEIEDDCAFRDLSCQMGADGVHRCCRTDCQPGESRCNGAFVEVCLLTGEGCADWVAARDCAAAGEGCEASDDGAQCTGEVGCIAECWTGETRCAGDTVEHCVDDGSGCFLWALGTDCAALGQSCVTGPEGTWCSGEACDHDCGAAGRTRCAGAAIQTCVADDAGCRRWAETGLCEDPTPACDESSGDALCVASLPD